MRLFRIWLLGFGSLIIFLLLISYYSFPITPAQAKDFDQNNLISDGEFTNIETMTTEEVQDFLTRKGSFLKDFSENGRSAAQIIAEAARGGGEASGKYGDIDITRTVNPKVILVTLQKEQSLISKTSQDDDALRKAMGYACPDSGGCNSKYAGFTKQVENGAWQLRYNYERATKGYSDYQVGQTQTFSDFNGSHTVTFANKATAALYRYTPHVYNGNYNFFNLYFNTYNFETPEYAARFAGQNGHPTLDIGQSYNFRVYLTNTGNATWTRDKVHLGTERGKDRVPDFTREDKVNNNPSGWSVPNRVVMEQASVSPGETAIFSFWYTVPASKGSGTYREYFRPVAEGITWMNDLGIYWEIKIPDLGEQYKAEWVEQNPYPTLSPGQSYRFTVSLRNVGTRTWTKDMVYLGTDRDKDRVPIFTREDQVSNNPSGWSAPNRVVMEQHGVAPAGIATFSFWYTVPADWGPGTYREYFRPVADGITWMNDMGIYWDIIVQ